jgi:hypothetical protein
MGASPLVTAWLVLALVCVSLNVPVPWLLNRAPVSAVIFGELRKQNDAQWIGAKPCPAAT